MGFLEEGSRVPRALITIEVIMPIYEYKCNVCGETSELLIKNTKNQTGLECSHCSSSDLSRLISAPGVLKSKTSGSTMANVPPINCPNQGTCGMAADSSCPAARSRR